ncbi:MAG: DNA mismatch repair protein MutS [Halodesulfurarchaeum sp.]
MGVVCVTGIVEEYFDCKSETDADLLAMQVGDFYEFFDDDAELVADELDLKVSTKSSHGSSYPMAGVPVDDLTPYLKTLVERGYRVAVADQHEVDDGHERRVERVVTPGTLLETTQESAQYLAAVVRPEEDVVGLAFVDVTTGRFHVTQVTSIEDALTELYRFDPVEIVPGPGFASEDDTDVGPRDDSDADSITDRVGATVSDFDLDEFAPGAATHTLRSHFGEEALHSLGIEPGSAAVMAAGGALSYVEATGLGVNESFTRLQPYRADDHVELDATTQRNLELTETMHGERSGSLFDTIDHTVTSAGGRLLREWLQRPRQSKDELERRLDSVEAVTTAALARDSIRQTLDGAYDLERLASRVAHETADARHLLRIRDTLALLPEVLDTVTGSPELADSPMERVLSQPDVDAVETLHDELDQALVEDPPKTLREGGLFQRGYDDDLDELIDGYEEATSWIDGLADREKQRLGITHLQVGRNQTDGYYIQVGRSETDAVPEEYREIKSLKNSKRYTTDALDERERRVLRLEDERADLEYSLFEDLRSRVADRTGLLREAGSALAELDVLLSLGVHAVENDWTRPGLTTGDVLDVEAGRHPVVEQTTEFVPNDVQLSGDRRFLLVTGPNMSGKSTYLRQNALVVLLSQIGSFVPARSATVGLVDGIFTRVGALDELAQGRSTFMVEMQELSNILHSATEDSLVILDEVGRGTATYDGISIAWAATEYLHNEVRAKTLFATHYHELTHLADHLESVANVHVAADERDGEITFLYTVRRGATDRSYGIHVAELAGVPRPVVDRADEVLENLRAEKAIEAKGGGTEPVQAVFDLESGTFQGDGASSSDETPPGATRVSGESEESRSSGETGVSGESGAPGKSADGEWIDREQASVLEAIADMPVNELTPVEVLSRVSTLQEQLE